MSFVLNLSLKCCPEVQLSYLKKKRNAFFFKMMPLIIYHNCHVMTIMSILDSFLGQFVLTVLPFSPNRKPSKTLETNATPLTNENGTEKDS